ncbi:MAG: T9SS type A sorting domain-containing protein [Bacteroidetes bacterium]|nr:T9SS type A sorting domain-containing protein [Bacteroidota bacterium]
MKNFILATFILISALASSQSNYQRKLFQAPATGTVSEVVYSNEYNTTTFVIENLIGTGQYSGFSTITKFTTTTGNVTSSKSFSIAGYDLAIKSVVKSNQILYMVASLTNSAGVTGMIIKYNLSTNTSSWRRTVAISQTPYVLNTIAFDNDKYLYAVGACNHFAFNSDLFVTKLDTNGTLLWVKELGENSLQHIPSSIIYNGKRELYVTSNGTLTTNSYAITLRLDSAGTILNTNVLNTIVSTGFREKFSAILNGKLVTIDKTVNSATGDAGPFLIRSMDSTLSVITTKTLTGVNIKQIFSNNVNLLVTGLAPVNTGFPGFRTIRFDAALNVYGSRYFKKISTTNNTSSASACIVTNNNSYHFFKANGNDTLTYVRTDIFEGVGCRDTAYAPASVALAYSVSPYTFTVMPITGTLTTITIPITTVTYSSTSLCTAITTGVNSISENGVLSVYPNPAKEMLNVRFEMINGEEKHIKFINSLGQVLIDQRSTDDNLKFDINNFQKGIYFISMYNTNNELIYIKKFIKE